jgi:hypothetical protein
VLSTARWRRVCPRLTGLSGDLVGKYYPLTKMTPEEEKQLIEVQAYSTHICSHHL